MDQVRKLLRWIKQQHFWLLCGISAVIALVLWNSARGKLAKDFETSKKTIEGEFVAEKKLQSEAFHANDNITAQQQREIDEQQKSVQATWKLLYDRQRKEVLEWPTALSKEFRSYVEKKKFGDEFPLALRTNYQNYADQHFESLPKIVQARVMSPGETAAGGMGAGRGGNMLMQPALEELPAQQDSFLCEWQDQQNVRDELEFAKTPSPLLIWVTQEDMWVYKTLLQIIANTNQAAGADRMSNAAIRTIASLQVGQPAALNSRLPGRIEMTQAAPGAPGAEPGLSGMGDTMAGPIMHDRNRGDFDSGGNSSVMGSGTAPTPLQEMASLLGGRYLDANGKPRGLDDPAAAEAATPSDQSSSQASLEAEQIKYIDPKAPYKRLPVRMVLEMDQRWLTHLICECANQPLQVEVTEVRINPPDVKITTNGGGGMAIGGGGGKAMGGGGAYKFEFKDRDGPRRGGRGGGGGFGGTTSTFKGHTPGEIGAFSPQPNLATVVVQGIIYIFQDPAIVAPPAPQTAGP